MSISKKRPATIHIKPQRMGFQFDAAEVPRYWYDGDPVLSHFMNVFSLTFPDGEQFFVDSVRALREGISDPARQKDISGFIGQEAMHSLEHKSFNTVLDGHGYGDLAEAATRQARSMLKFARKHFSPRHQLAATAGLEHLTAILADVMLAHPEEMQRMHPSVRSLWLWHAIEETEHKAVAFDLYQDVSGDYALRVGIFLRASLALGVFMGVHTYKLLERDGLHRRPRVLARGLWKMWGYKGMLSRVIPAYLDYLRPGFHPWDHDNSALIARYKSQLEAAVAASQQAA